MGYILNSQELLEKGNSIKDKISIEKIISLYVYEIEKRLKNLRAS